MKWKSAFILAFIVGTALTGTSCDDSPTAPTAETLTDNFSGIVGAGQSIEHQFTEHVEGGASVILTSTALETPPEEGVTVTIPPIGLAIGTWDGTTCTRVAFLATAVVGSIISGSALPGEFCVAVYDPGGLTANVAYTGQVIHQ